NGAGKSTLLRVVAGLLRPTSGVVELAGSDLRGESAEEVARRGVALMVGGRGVFPSLSVEENLRLAGWQLRNDPERRRIATEEAMALFPALAGRRAERVANLSGGEQQMLALAGCLLVRPRLLLLDELSLGLAPATVARLLEAVRQARRSGTAVVVVEQSVNVALATAERAVFLEKGEVRFSGPTAELLERPDVLRSVFLAGAVRDLGGPDEPDESEESDAQAPAGAPPVVSVVCNSPPAGDGPVAEMVLDCRGVSRSFGGIQALRGVDLSARRGSIVGVLGPNGAGKTTLFDCISGFLPLDEGRISLCGNDVTAWTPAGRARAGLGRSFQDARLYPSLTVAETIAVSFERHLPCRSAVAAALHLPASFESEDELAARVEQLVELLGLVPFRDRLVSELSSGTRRVVELACALGQDPEVLLLDEPSAGVAQREVEALAPLLVRVRDITRCALVVIEHDVGLLASICEELVALDLGEVVARGVPAAVLEHPRVVESYLGSDLAAVHRSGPLTRA
ncbi:MAG: ATP-binding cassette domain-containing protein, partial [Acidimicrobiia bacterium]